MSEIVIFGGDSGIAQQGIITTVGGLAVPRKECDVRYYSHVRDTIMQYEPSVVINCAGVSFPKRVGADVSYQEEVNTNLMGCLHIADCAVRNNVRTMIFIASVAGMYGKPEHSGYSASKAGVISLVQSLGMEGYNAYAISPGRVDTPMRERDYPGEDPQTRLKPRQIGEVVKRILDGMYEPGSNIVVRMQGYETLPIEEDQGEPWKTRLKVGQPKTV